MWRTKYRPPQSGAVLPRRAGICPRGVEGSAAPSAGGTSRRAIPLLFLRRHQPPGYPIAHHAPGGRCRPCEEASPPRALPRDAGCVPHGASRRGRGNCFPRRPLRCCRVTMTAAVRTVHSRRPLVLAPIRLRALPACAPQSPGGFVRSARFRGGAAQSPDHSPVTALTCAHGADRTCAVGWQKGNNTISLSDIDPSLSLRFLFCFVSSRDTLYRSAGTKQKINSQCLRSHVYV